MEQTSSPENADAKTPAQGVKSLIRGLNVLVAVNENTPATVTKLVASTGLPKATVIRLLKTLQAEGFIEMDRLAGGYKALPKVRLLASPMISDSNFAIYVRHYLNDFAQTVKWPSEILMPEGSAMVVQASNRTTAPIHLKRFEQARFDLLSSASGLAYLSAASAIQRQELINSVASLKNGAEASQIAVTAYQNIEATQQRGYAIWDYHAPIEGTRAISIPLVANNTPFGAIALIMLRDVVSDDQLNNFLLPNLRHAAKAISDIYQQHGSIINLAPMSTYGISPPG